MSNSPHTPGPWHRDGLHIYGPHDPESRHPNGRVFIASVAQGTRRADPALDGSADRFGFDATTDARLITATPELLTACRHALNYFEAPDLYDEQDVIDALSHALESAGMLV